jgi:hypothetical protein
MSRSIKTVDRPFPWRCGNCGQEQVDRVNTPYTTAINYDGRAYEVVVPQSGIAHLCQLWRGGFR